MTDNNACSPAQKKNGPSKNSVRVFLWKLYVLQKIIWTNPFFNYGTFFRKLDEKFYAHCRKYICLQIFGKKMARETFQQCKKIGIEPFLVFGSLLGHYRDNGFVGHDSDVDIGLLEADFSKIDELKELMKKKGYVVRGQSQYGVSFKKPRFKGLNVDFYLFKEKDSQMECCVGIKNQWGMCYYPKEIFADFVSVKFLEEVDVLIPVQTEAYLTQTYGNWQVPNINYDTHTDCQSLQKT